MSEPCLSPGRLAGARALAPLLLVLPLVAGCVTQLGPRTVPTARFSYNQAVAVSRDQQVLLNLVRLRYRDNPLFLDIGSVTAQYSLDASASLAATAGEGGAWGAGAGAGVDYGERPTITLTPLGGQDFVSQMLSPITPPTLVLLAQSGWSVERLLICCVQEINGLRNAVAAAGPTPDYVPRYEPFHRLAARLRELQIAELLRVEPDGTGNLLVELPAEVPAALAPALAEVRELLGLAPEVTLLRTVASHRDRGPTDLAITGRSLVAVMFFLSQAVAAPPEHVEQGLVTVTRTADGTPFDWRLVTGRILDVRVSREPPADAAIAVPYRDHWFWIADSDLTSKSTFSLVSFLFSLKAGASGGREPLLTIGVD